MADKLIKKGDGLYEFRGHTIEVIRPGKKKKDWVVTVTTPSGDVWKSEAKGTRDGVAKQAARGIDMFSNPADVIAISKDRYRASAEEKRRYGGSTVTTFYVMRSADEDDASKWDVITGYGKSPADRKRDAIEKFRKKHMNPKRRRANVSVMSPEYEYVQDLGGELVWFKPQSQLKNGNWKGVLVRAGGKSKNASVTKMDMRLWDRALRGDMPMDVLEVFHPEVAEAERERGRTNNARSKNSPARVKGNRPITRADYPAIFGDFDLDTITDADDPRPRTPGDTESIEEVRLADEMDALLATRAEFVPVADEIQETLVGFDVDGAKVKSRVKTPFSILNKLRRKRLGTLTDVAGAMMIVPDHKALKKAARQIEDTFEVIDREDYYDRPQNGYRALHYIVRVQGKPVELQLKTERMAAIAKASHTAYKRGELDGTSMEYLTEVALRADRGDAEAARQIDKLLADPRALKLRLKATNPRRDCKMMPEDPWAYFTRPRGTVLMPLEDLQPIRARESGIRNAEKYMKAACSGDHEKRKPITVHPETMQVLDGNSTFAVASSWGWREIPVTFARTANPADLGVLRLARRLAGGG